MNPIKETIIEKQEIKQEEKEKSYKLEYVISRKVNKYYEEEVNILYQLNNGPDFSSQAKDQRTSSGKRSSN
jgi:hypothetical protein